MNKMEAVEPVKIEGKEYDYYESGRKDSIELKFRETSIPREMFHPRFIDIIVLNVDEETLEKEIEEENRIDLAQDSIEKYKISKEIIKRVEERYEQLMNSALKEIGDLIEKIDNID